MRAEVWRGDDSTSWYEAPEPDDGADRLAYVWWDDSDDYGQWSWVVIDTPDEYTTEGGSTTREGAERDVVAILRARGHVVEGG